MRKQVAIIGHSFRFPGCGPKTFWQSLLDKKDLVTEVDPERWSKETYQHPEKGHQGSTYSFAAGSLGDVSGFDAGFFGLSPREVMHMDPQQRLLLEMSWEAMESAGIPPSRLRGSNTGVFIGIASGDYGYRFADDWCSIGPNTGTGTAPSIASNRISYVFDLRGPSISMDTACSSSMVAFHQACRSILSGETEQALTGGISLHLHPYGFIVFAQATMLSPTGRCQVFDAAGDGYVRSEGGGVFLLKDYAKAVADGDPILAVVAASAVNTDGHKSGLTVPSIEAQANLMRQAYAQAGIGPDDVDYLEAHGTGTPVGDPIEACAIGRALGQQRSRPLPIGSVKSNLGHLETASGVAGLAKALYAIRHREVPATIGIKQINPNILTEEWNIEVVTDTMQLDPEKPLCIGINSFGFGGANAHVVLQSPPPMPKAPVRSRRTKPAAIKQPLPLRLSARSPEALRALAGDMGDLIGSAGSSLYDIAWASHTQRDLHCQALLTFVEDPDSAAASLHDFALNGSAPGVYTAAAKLQAEGPVFVYSGNGCQWEQMGKLLLTQSREFRQSITKVDKIFAKYADFSLLEEFEGLNGTGRYSRTEVAQPALFALQVGITEWLRSRGIQPVAVIGHSVGEAAAAWASGALSLEQAVKVIYYRSYYQGKTAGLGQMTAVACSAVEMESLLQELQPGVVCVAGASSPRGITIAGEVAGLEIVEAFLSLHSLRFKRLDLDYAFHSPLMDSVESGIKAALADLQPSATKVPFISTVTGAELSGTELVADYWWRNVREPVAFADALALLAERQLNTFVELGGHPVLRGYLNENLRANEISGTVIATLSRREGDQEKLEQAYAQLLLCGLGFELERWFPVAGERVELPVYPWQRQEFWHPTSAESIGLLDRHYEHPLLGYRLSRTGLTWEAHLDTQRQPWLADHQVGDGVVFPGAGFVELILAAASAWKSSTVIDIEDFEILAPLLLDQSHTKVVRTEINPGNGQVRISSRELAKQEDWREHVRARIFSGTVGLQLTRQAQPLPTRKPDFLRQQHLQDAAEIGLDYGPAFQAVSHGWLEGDSVIGACECPPVIAEALPESLLHPGILDSALQLFIQLLLARRGSYPGVGFVPTRVGRVQFDAYQVGQEPSYLCLRQKRLSPHSLLADIEIFASDGSAIAVLTDVRFQPVPLRGAKRLNIQMLDYELVPAPLQNRMPAIDIPGWQRTQLDYSAHLLADSAYAAELEPLLDTLVTTFIAAALQQPRNLQALDGSARQWAQSLLDEGSLEVNEGGDLQVAVDVPDVEPQQFWQMLAQEYPASFPLIQAVGRFGLQLQHWLDGESLEFLPDERLYMELSRTISGEQALESIAASWAQGIGELVGHLGTDQRLSVMEFGAGRPILARAVCSGLDFDRADYTFLSENADSVAEASNQLDSFPQARVERLDPGAAPDPAIPAAQLVFVHLDTLALADARQLLQAVRRRSLPGARVLLLGRYPSFWLNQVFAANPGWWQAGGQTRQLSLENWQTLLAEQGFAVQQSVAGDGAGTFCLACEVDATGENEVVPESLPSASAWLLLGAEGDRPLAQQLLESAAQSTSQSSSQSAAQSATRTELPSVAQCDDLGALNNELLALPASCETVRIIVLSDLFDRSSSAAQVQHCARLRDVLKLIEAQPRQVECWVLTTGVGALLTTDSNLLAGGATAPMDAACWGFVRSLMNEASRTQFRLVDLPLKPDTAALTALAQLLQQGTDEDEQVLFADGSRFVPRLKTVHEQVDSQSGNRREAVTLGFDLPGQLRNLRWLGTPLAEPGAGEVEVEVDATGLNFRDVMYALGMLSDEAIENGFSGPTLGLEFAGRVVATGPDVTDFRPGDAVVGFGPSSFSNRMIAPVNAIAHIPAELSAESAATIPTTFFTVYYALKHLAQLQPGERILIHGAAGGVGLAAIQVASWLGAEIFATVGSPAKRDVVRLLGVDNIYDSRSLSFGEEILAATPDGKGVDVVLNSLAGEAINQNLRVLKPFGRFLELGKRDFYENTAIGLRPFRNNISYFGIDSDQLMSERPQLTATLFREMMALFADGTFYPLPYTSFSADKVVEAFRFMQQARQIGKVVVNYRQLPRAEVRNGTKETSAALQLDANATYLVTGGLAGFGLRTAAWLVEKGARQLVLLSRSGLKGEAAKAGVAELEARGAAVTAVACDIADRAAVKALLSQIARDLPPLKGVVHAACVFDDALAINMSDSQIAAVMAPKVEGAQVLHELTRSLELDLFVLFSSATTCFGNPGQSNYVAANHWLEGLAVTRKAQGLAATCVRFGAIDDVGYLARNEAIKGALESRMGGRALSSDLALAMLEKMLLDGVTLRAVLELEWSSMARFLPNALAPKFRQLALLAGDSGDMLGSAAELLMFLEGLAPEEQHAEVVAMLRKNLSQILMLPEEQIGADASVFDLGFDSLMGVELMVAIEERFGVQLPAMTLSEATTLNKLAAKLLSKLFADGADDDAGTIEYMAIQHGVSDEDMTG
ncbi:MAG: type I polyketide synthase [Gammaproteobacteria bacterium]|nr:type I polyketide synthase [Gammaproteobacteria bacterium]